MVEREESEHEVIIVAVAVSPSLDGADFIVDPLDWSCGDRFIVPAEQPGSVPEECLAHGLQDADSGRMRSSTPVFQKTLGVSLLNNPVEIGLYENRI